MSADPTTKIVTSCPRCGSFLVLQDAQVVVNTGEYHCHDTITCGDCGYDGYQFIETVVPIDFDIDIDELPEVT